jgi:hypothetical protein
MPLRCRLYTKSALVKNPAMNEDVEETMAPRFQRLPFEDGKEGAPLQAVSFQLSRTLSPEKRFSAGLLYDFASCIEHLVRGGRYSENSMISACRSAGILG